jgi:hypothetical protein
MGNECAFVKGDINYYDKSDCEKNVVAVSEVLTSRSIVNSGTCFLIKPEQT